ncbi:hypothetical protein [Bacillus cereus]|uniref:hypothetical protein n=1 Tax=Bacillus cereus TaxID=1396 RepID=UPI00211D1B6F|nr:hypothetical protein [Bacillus cereus]MCU5519824.1 hypothetical protein [Bacillus cereus]
MSKLTNEHRYFGSVFSYVDESGEKRISAPSSSHKVISIAQSDAYKEKVELENFRIGRQADFTASNMDTLHEVYSVLTTAQCGYLMLLQCYVSYDGGTLVNANKTAMTTNDMMNVLQLKHKRSSFYDFIKACMKYRIITEEDGVYAVNPRYHFRGVFSNRYVVKSYTAKIRRVYREVKATDIGLIYRMLPFIHYDTNALCENPSEVDPKKIRWFNRKELSEAIGINSDTLGRRLPKMTIDGSYVVARIKVGNEPERYTFNPNVFYRKGCEPDKTLQAMFNVKKG